VFTFLFFSLVALPALAQEPVQVNYQGRLTDSGGNPLTGSYNLTFSIYNAYGSVWSETQSGVSVTNGLFNVMLGSVAPLYDTTFDNSGQFLGIKVGSDPEMTPHTPLAFVPGAAYACRVLGSVQTADGQLAIENPSGDKMVQFAVDTDSSTFAIDWADPTGKSLRRPALRMSASATHNMFNLYHSSSAYAGHSVMSLEADYLGDIAWRMFDPQPEPPGKMFEIVSTAGTNPAMRFFTHGEEVMGVEPSPFNTGYSIVGFDPQPEPPGIMFELGNEYGQRASLAYLNMYGPVDGAAYRKHVALTADGSGSEFRIGPGTDPGATVLPHISLLSGNDDSRIDLVGPAELGGPSMITLTTPSTGPRIGIGTSSPTQALHVIGNICYTGTIGACSDVKYKKDIQEITGALDAVEHLDGVRYSWRTDEFPSMHFSDSRQVGFVAQNVKATVPEAVIESADGSLSVDYSRLTPLLVEAIKELKAENESLKKRLEALEKK